MSLDKYRNGYGVMNADLEGISIDSESIDDLIPYCRNGRVIAERISYVYGFTIQISFMKFYKPFYFKSYAMKNILWFHWVTRKEYGHKTGKIVYKST